MEVENINVNEEVVEQTTSTEQVEEKMLPQSKVNEIVEKRLAKERNKLDKQWQEKFNALEESIKLQSMSEKEKTDYQNQKEQEQFEEERKKFYEERDAFNKLQYQATIEKELIQRNLPTEFAGILINSDSEQVYATINAIQVAFNDAVEKAVKAQIGQNAPKVSESQGERLLTFDEISKLSREEYARNKDLVNRSLQALNK